MFTTAEKTIKPGAAVQKQSAGSFFGPTRSDSFFGSGEKVAAPASFIQPKLNIGRPDDPLEHEADSMARQVMTMPEPGMATASEPELQRQEEDEVQRSIPEQEINRQHEPETVQPRPMASASLLRSADEEIQPKIAASDSVKNTGTVTISKSEIQHIQRTERGPPLDTGPPADFEATLSATRGSGSPLPAETRAFMEKRFGADFSGVRIHTNETAVRFARAISAHAFAYGNDIYFNSGKFAPSTSEGKELLAHELTHTLQQGASRHVAKSTRARINRSLLLQRTENENHEREEAEAEGSSYKVQRSVSTRSTNAVQRGWFGDSKAELLKWIRDKARQQKGYTLLTVIIGKDPITDTPVARSTENILAGFMTLTDAGTSQYQQMKQTGALARAAGKIDAAIAGLNFSWAYVKGLFKKAWDSLSWGDLLAPIDAFNRVFYIFADPIRRLGNMATTIISFVFEVILGMMGFPSDMLGKLADNVKRSWSAIKAHPIDFFLNILKAIKRGFSQFFDNFPKHLQAGLMDWVFGQLKGVGVTRPPDLSGKSILKMVLQILDITPEKIWKKLADKLGPEKVEKLRANLDKLEGVWTFIRDVQQRGAIAIWEHVQTQLSNLWDTIMQAAEKWVQEKIISAVTTKLLSMLDPTGIMAVINSCIALYKVIESFIENFKKILLIVNSFVEGIAQIATGNIGRAANTMEGSMARSLSVMISFLANQVGMNKIGAKVLEIIKSVRLKVDKALDWLINKAVNTATAVFDTVKTGIQKLKNWWKARFDFTGSDNLSHKIHFVGEEENAEMIIESKPMNFTQFLNEYMTDSQTPPAGRNAIADRENAKKIAATVDKMKYQRAPKDISELDKEKWNAEKQDRMQEELKLLADILQHYFSRGGADNKIYNRRMYGDFAHECEATSLDKGIGYGSAPGGALPPVYKSLNKRRTGEGSAFYVRGHLINDNLGGKGEWTNMTPLPHTENTRFEQEVESRMKRAVESGTTININVKAEYGRTAPGNEVLGQINAMAATADQKRDLIDILTNEQHVPQSLTVKSHILKKNGPQWEEGPALVPSTKFKINLPQKPVLGAEGYVLAK